MAGIWAGGIAAVLAVTALGVVWLWRVREARRLKAAMDAFAERESLRELRIAAPRRRQVRT